MVVCSFVGHEEMYDTNMASRMKAEVDRLIKEHEIVEFLIYPAGMPCYTFLLTVLRARTQHPQKVTITFVSYHNSDSKMNTQELACSYISDKIITLHMEDTEKNDPTIGYKRMLKWIIQNSTHLIRYFYDMLYDPYNLQVKGPETSEIINLITHETEMAILEAASYMPEKEQSIFYKLLEGHTMKEAGKAVGVGKERARQLIVRGCKTIRLELRKRYHQAMFAKPLGPRTCGLFILGEPTYTSLTRFKYIIEFLSSVYIASDIYVERSYIFSGFLFVLENMNIPIIPQQRIYDTTIHITAVLKGDNSATKDSDVIDSIKSKLCPPCHAIEYVSGVDIENNTDDFKVIADMIERMDFCICNLSATPYAEKIKQYAAQTGRTVLLDIGRRNGGTDKAVDPNNGSK